MRRTMIICLANSIFYRAMNRLIMSFIKNYCCNIYIIAYSDNKKNTPRDERGVFYIIATTLLLLPHFALQLVFLLSC